MSSFISLEESLQGGSFCFLVRDSPIPLALFEQSHIFFSARSQRVLEGAGLWSPEGLLRSTEASLRRIPGVGVKTVQMVRALLEFYGLSLGRRLGKDLKTTIQDVKARRHWSQSRMESVASLDSDHAKLFRYSLYEQVLMVKYLKVLARIVPAQGAHDPESTQQQSIKLLLERVRLHQNATQETLFQEIQRRQVIIKDARRCLRKMRGSKNTPLELVARTLRGLQPNW